MNTYSKEEVGLMIAGLELIEANGSPRAKLAWALSSLMGKEEKAVMYKLNALANEDHNPLEESLPTVREQAIDVKQQIGDVVVVKAVAIKTYGVICAVEGTARTMLLHISEIADEFVSDIGEYVTLDTRFRAIIIVSNDNRLALSTRRIGSLAKKGGVNSAFDKYKGRI